MVENKLFSTLNPTTRKLVLPSNNEILITDTVGFIRNLPKELLKAFSATLEEMGDSSLLVHVADASDPHVGERIEAVEKILEATGFDSIPRAFIFNKTDSTPLETVERLRKSYNAPLISALNKESLIGLLDLLEEKLFRQPIYDREQVTA
jgi:GTP-binding protein HflX